MIKCRFLSKMSSIGSLERKLQRIRIYTFSYYVPLIIFSEVTSLFLSMERLNAISFLKKKNFFSDLKNFPTSGVANSGRIYNPGPTSTSNGKQPVRKKQKCYKISFYLVRVSYIYHEKFHFISTMKSYILISSHSVIKMQ